MNVFQLVEREPTCSIVVKWVQNLQTELMVQKYSKSLVKAIGKNMSHKIELEHQSKPIKVMQNGCFGGLH